MKKASGLKEELVSFKKYQSWNYKQPRCYLK